MRMLLSLAHPGTYEEKTIDDDILEAFSNMMIDESDDDSRLSLVLAFIDDYEDYDKLYTSRTTSSPTTMNE